MITVRVPDFDFSESKIIWSTTPEFAHICNGMSMAAPLVEPYLNKVMLRCLKKFGDRNPDLTAEVTSFVQQELSHYRMHMRFNERIYANGYDEVRQLDAKFKAELRELLDQHSLEFNAAYCAGFETFTLYTAKFMFSKAADLFENCDPGGADLWLWHLAEEYEHRSVCHDVFATVSGNYFTRVHGLWRAFWHINGFVGEAAQFMLRKHRASMTPQERRASLKQERAYKRRFMLYALPRMLAILVPYYDPGKVQAPAALHEALRNYAARSMDPAVLAAQSDPTGAA